MTELLNNKLDSLIMESMKAHNLVRTRTLRLIKAAFLEAAKAPGATQLDNIKEIQILQKWLNNEKMQDNSILMQIVLN